VKGGEEEGATIIPKREKRGGKRFFYCYRRGDSGRSDTALRGKGKKKKLIILKRGKERVLT